MAGVLHKIRIVGGIHKLSLEIDGKEIEGLRSVEFRASFDDVPEVTLTMHAGAVEIEIDESAQQVEDALRRGGVRAKATRHTGRSGKLTIPIEVTVSGPDEKTRIDAARRLLRDLKDDGKDT